MFLKCARSIEVSLVINFKLKHSKHSTLMILQDPFEVNLIYAKHLHSRDWNKSSFYPLVLSTYVVTPIDVHSLLSLRYRFRLNIIMAAMD